MKSLISKRSKNMVSGRTLACVVLSGLCITPASSAQAKFVPNVPDFFQHQKWGKAGKDDPGAEKYWEFGDRAVPWRGTGWCYLVSTINQFYYFKKKDNDKFGGLLDDKVLKDKTWLDAVSTEITDLRDLTTRHTHADGYKDVCKGDPVRVFSKTVQDEINCVLKNRTGDPSKVGNLARQYVFSQERAFQYISSDGMLRMHPTTAPNFLKLVADYLDQGAAVDLYIIHPEQTSRLWWSGRNYITEMGPFKGWPATGGFHSVTVAGYDLKGDKAAPNGKLWFSDPDSNPDQGDAAGTGNANSNAGWTLKSPYQDDQQVKDYLAAVKKRRFGKDDKLPVPDPDKLKPDSPDVKARYFEAAMAEGKYSFAKASQEKFNRYDDVEILGLNTLEVTQVGKPRDKKEGMTDDGGYPLEVRPGTYGAAPINEFWVFSSSSQNMITQVTLSPDDQKLWSAELVSGIDPWGNYRPFDGIHVKTKSSGDALVGDQALDLTIYTVEKPLDAFDAVLQDRTDPSSVRLQVFGANLPDVYSQGPTITN